MCDLKKVIFKNAVKRLAKSQFGLYNREFTFKILRFQKSTILSAIWKSRFSAFSNRNF
jgi:hypothetical protein